MYEYINFLNQFPNWDRIFENSKEFKEPARIYVLIHLKTCVFYKSNAGLTLLKTVEIAWKCVKVWKDTNERKNCPIYILLVYLDVINFSIHTAFGEDLKEGYCPWLLSDSTLPRLDPQPTQSETHNSLRLAVSGNTNRLCLHTFVLTTDEALWVWHEFALNFGSFEQNKRYIKVFGWCRLGCKTVSVLVVHVCYRTCQYIDYLPISSIAFLSEYTIPVSRLKLTMKSAWWKTSYKSTKYNVRKLQVSDICLFVSNSKCGIHTLYHRYAKAVRAKSW